MSLLTPVFALPSPGGPMTLRVGRRPRWAPSRGSRARTLLCPQGPVPAPRGRRLCRAGSRRPRTSPTRLGGATADQAVAVRASPEGLSGPGPRAGQRGATRWSPWAWGGAFSGVPGPGPCGPGTRVRAEPSKEAPGGGQGWRFVYPAFERLLATGSTENRPGERPQVRDLPASGRSLPPGGGLAGRPGRDQPRGRQGPAARACAPTACPSGS